MRTQQPFPMHGTTRRALRAAVAALALVAYCSPWSMAADNGPSADDEPAIEVVPQSEAAGPVVDDGARRVKSIRDVSIDIGVRGDAPQELAPPDLPHAQPITSTAQTRGWNDSVFFWQASNMVHKPLYFEQRYVERYGYNFGPLQPVASGVQFFGTVAVLPVKMWRHPPGECVFSLGYDRPGSFGTLSPRR